MLNTFCPGRGSNQDLLRGSQTLYRVTIKAGLYCKAVQMCIIPNITTVMHLIATEKTMHLIPSKTGMLLIDPETPIHLTAPEKVMTLVAAE